MSRGVNKVILIGNIGRDPEVRYTTSGAAVVTLALATSESWKNKQTGDQEVQTEWHRVVFFNKLAEIAQEYLRKGSKLYIEGSLRTRKWQDANGQDRYTTEIIGNNMEMLDKKGEIDNDAPLAREPAQAPKESAAAQSASAKTADISDDDVPF